MAVKEIFFRSGFNYDRDAVSRSTGLECLDKSLTIQSALEESDINTIVRRFGLSGQLPAGVRMPTYGDFVDVPDFHGAMNAIAAARESFDAMPAHVRARFNNDPGSFVDFCSDEKNRAEALSLGLVNKPLEAVIKPVVAPGAVNPTAGSEPAAVASPAAGTPPGGG